MGVSTEHADIIEFLPLRLALGGVRFELIIRGISNNTSCRSPDQESG